LDSFEKTRLVIYGLICKFDEKVALRNQI